MKKTAKTAIVKVVHYELAMIPALIMCIYDAFRLARWDMYEFETINGYTGTDLVDSFFKIARTYIVDNIPVLACMAVVIAIIAIVIALRKGKTK